MSVMMRAATFPALPMIRAGSLRRPVTLGVTAPIARAALIFAVVFVQICDIVSTLIAVSLGMAEANPLMSVILNGGGTMGFVLAKVAITVLLGYSVRKLELGWAAAAGLGAILITSVAVVSNVILVGQA